MSRFATTFKQVRLAKRWKQEDLAEALHVKLRTVISWETGTRLPSIGMVFLLCGLLTDGQAETIDLLQHTLFINYLIDDIRQQAQIHHNDGFHLLAEEAMQKLLVIEEERDHRSRQSFPLSLDNLTYENQRVITQNQQQGQITSSQPETSDTLQQLFVLIERFREHPELVSVTNDFLQEVVGN